MVDRLSGFSVSLLDRGPRAALLDLVLNQSDSLEFEGLLKQRKLSMDTLRKKAMSVNREALLRFDPLIALQAKFLEGFQRSYEHVKHRKLHAEQLGSTSSYCDGMFGRWRFSFQGLNTDSR